MVSGPVALGGVDKELCGQGAGVEDKEGKGKEGSGETSQWFRKSCLDRSRGWDDSRHGCLRGLCGRLTRTTVSAWPPPPLGIGGAVVILTPPLVDLLCNRFTAQPGVSPVGLPRESGGLSICRMDP